VNKLKSFDTEIIKESVNSEEASDAPISKNDFDEVWVTLPEPKTLIPDNVSMSVKAVETLKWSLSPNGSKRYTEGTQSVSALLFRYALQRLVGIYFVNSFIVIGLENFTLYLAIHLQR